VESKDATLRFNYNKKFLRWAVTVPGQYDDWVVGVRSTTGKKPLCGFISAIPVHLSIEGRKIKAAEINFLCVHKRIRSKKIAPQLIKEVTRRVNLRKVW